MPFFPLFILSPDAAGERAALHRQRSLPHRPPVIPLVARMADQNTSGTPAMTEREASRLDKFKQLLAGPNTDLGKTCSFRNSPLTCQCVLLCVISLSPLVSIWLLPLYISHLLFTWAFFILPAPSLLYFLSFWLLTLTLLALSASCAVLLTMLQGVSHPAIWTCRLREEKKCHQQQKLVRGLCSNQTTGLYCLSNPRDCLLSLPSQCPWNLVDPLLMVDFVSSNTNFWHVLPVNLEKKNEVAIE